MISTLIIIAITCVVSFFAFNDAALMRRLILWPPAVEQQKEYYRLITYGFIHADGQHLLFNMMTLFFFGRAMEGFFSSELGPLGFAIFYVGGLVVSILPTFLKNRNNSNYHSLGASGAVSAVLFAFILIEPWAKILVFVVPMPAIDDCSTPLMVDSIESSWRSPNSGLVLSLVCVLTRSTTAL